ncbi:MAG: 4Fe-4S binding protein [Victivallaceae bacterium]|nr:4Fe-4S binding protein [Victivallaceae bacterium]
MKRNIVEIDREKCNGCGDCVTACAEGAIQIIDGKAELITDSYCDGLGECLGHCPMDAIKIIEREADEFDEAAVAENVKKHKMAAASNQHHDSAHSQPASAGGGCPGSMLRNLMKDRPQQKPSSAPRQESGAQSELRQWPVQLHLAPPNSPNWDGAELLLCADCVPVAYPDFHQNLLRGRQVVIACPKLDGTDGYLEKLTGILRDNDIRSLSVARMEVPCCGGLTRLAETALKASGKKIPFQNIIVKIDGTLD